MRLSASIVAMLCGTWPGAVNAHEVYCPFDYHRVMEGLVIPEAKKKLGDNYAALDVDHPLLFQSGDKLEVTLSFGPSDKHELPLDADDFVVRIDACDFKVLSSGYESTSPNGRP
jgi:hypothetical protein